MALQKREALKQMGEAVVDQLEFQGIASEFAQRTEGGQLAADVLNGLEVVVFLEGDSERDVVFHLAEVLDRAGVGIVVD